MIFCGVLIVLIGGGLRQSFGVFLRPVSLDMGIGREAFGLVLAAQALIYGVSQPVVGMLADRFGAIRMIIAGAALYALGLWLASIAMSATDLGLGLGLVVGLGLSGPTQVLVMGAVGKAVPENRRSVVFGTIIASTSLGMFLFVPGAQFLLDAVGWRDAFLYLALLLALVPFFAFRLGSAPPVPTAGPKQSLREAIDEARGHSGYLLLTAGFFVCGFHVTFIATHLPAFLVDNDVSPTLAANALAMIGLFNVAGAYIFGALGDRFSKKNLLCILYTARAVVMGMVLIVPINDVTAIIFGVCMGLLWLATVPLTSGIVAQIFGTRYFSMLFGVVIMSHQFGSFAGAWLGGYIYDVTGTYDLMWLAAAGVGLLATVLHWPIREAPLARLSQEQA
ncbi:MAG: MFS transporter [Rhodospirillaceae bacterium]|nr:MFS transporter [Rhodospirillaceae bacterium]MDD9925518.1 MFS transporter [Rhodospirillaceae bacterium]